MGTNGRPCGSGSAAVPRKPPGGRETMPAAMERRKKPMRHRLLSIIMVLSCLSADPVYALFGEGDTVFDPTNFTKNAITAAQMMEQVKQMLHQVGNSDQEVTMMLQNLVAVLGARYNYPLYANLIREVM